MNQVPSIYDTENLIKSFYGHQKNDNGEFCYDHCIRIAEMCMKHGLSFDCVHAAYLHDIFENDINFPDLKELGYSDLTIDLIIKLTKDKDQTYNEYIRDNVIIIEKCSQFKYNEVIHILIFDIMDMTDPIRLYKMPNKNNFHQLIENYYYNLSFLKLFLSIDDQLNKHIINEVSFRLNILERIIYINDEK